MVYNQEVLKKNKTKRLHVLSVFGKWVELRTFQHPINLIWKSEIKFLHNPQLFPLLYWFSVEELVLKYEVRLLLVNMWSVKAVGPDEILMEILSALNNFKILKAIEIINEMPWDRATWIITRILKNRACNRIKLEIGKKDAGTIRAICDQKTVRARKITCLLVYTAIWESMTQRAFWNIISF